MNSQRLKLFLASTFLVLNAQAEDSNMPTKEELKKTLTPQQYNCTQEAGTEAPFNNAYWNNHADGIYVDVVSGEPLFSSLDKYDSKTGWPSFTKPIEDESVTTHADHTLAMPRVELKSKKAGSHLGHVFDDGPGPTKKRFRGRKQLNARLGRRRGCLNRRFLCGWRLWLRSFQFRKLNLVLQEDDCHQDLRNLEIAQELGKGAEYHLYRRHEPSRLFLLLWEDFYAETK